MLDPHTDCEVILLPEIFKPEGKTGISGPSNQGITDHQEALVSMPFLQTAFIDDFLNNLLFKKFHFHINFHVLI